MKILMVNKFLFPKGGAETYVLKLGEHLEALGHEVQYFGMEHTGRAVGNRVNAYTSDMDFHEGAKLAKLLYPIKTIYSLEARKKIRLVLDDFQPDVCHLNNFNYQLTPSIILEIRKWEQRMGRKCRIVYTAHDYQLVCPNHLCHNPISHENCEKCLGGHFANCLWGRCVHGSLAKSMVGTMEAVFWKWAGVYRQIDRIICCSHFMKRKLDTDPVLASKTVALHNFVEQVEEITVQKRDYVLYFGRYSQEKGVQTLVSAAKELPEIPFVFAGAGPLESLLENVPNITDVGFQTGDSLANLIREARFTVHPSVCYDNCPFSVMESQMYGTFALGADIGGIPELIRVGETGQLFASGDVARLKEAISQVWAGRNQSNPKPLKADFLSVDAYCQVLLKEIYR